jgi:hypothetical protein
MRKESIRSAGEKAGGRRVSFRGASAQKPIRLPVGSKEETPRRILKLRRGWDWTDSRIRILASALGPA